MGMCTAAAHAARGVGTPPRCRRLRVPLQSLSSSLLLLLLLHYRIIGNGGGHGLAGDRPAHFFLSGPAAAPPGVTVRPTAPTGCISDA